MDDFIMRQRSLNEFRMIATIGADGQVERLYQLNDQGRLARPIRERRPRRVRELLAERRQVFERVSEAYENISWIFKEDEKNVQKMQEDPQREDDFSEGYWQHLEAAFRDLREALMIKNGIPQQVVGSSEEEPEPEQT